MTRPEITNFRDLTFSKWIRENLPDSKLGFLVSDLDFILCNYKTKKVMLLEIKTHNKEQSLWQKILFANLDKWIMKGIYPNWQYLGFHIIMFENTNFNDGLVFFDNEEITEKELIYQLSF